MLHLVSFWEEVRNMPNERKTEALVWSHFGRDPCGSGSASTFADGKHLEIFSPSTGTPLIERGLIDEVDVHVLPRLLGAGTWLYDVAGGSMRKMQNLGRRRPECPTNLRFRTTYEN